LESTIFRTGIVTFITAIKLQHRKGGKVHHVSGQFASV